ncbi:hypothetical protein C1646_676176 [Rhizophagus diaphanus]|nr:hypothetical protein C1646_676176 [Rhizophagus diaphanus] [Rhizophagus sp. MUCL 43196]
MAQNTRSKSSSKMAHKSKFENCENISDEELIIETYGPSKEKIGHQTNLQKQAKRPKIDAPLESNTLQKNNDNMDIDEQNEKEKPRDSENNDISHDLIQSNLQEPIINEDTAMNYDQHAQGSNGANLTRSANTNITQDNNINTKKHHTNIFKETDGQLNNLFIAFFTRDQFERTKNDNEILNDIKNAYLTNNDVIEFKHRRKATLEYFTITVKNQNSFTKIINEPAHLLNGIKPLAFSANIID